jgi:hypothetical protein
MYNREKIMKTMDAIVEESNSIKPYVVVAQPRRDLSETPAQNFQGYQGIHVDFSGFSRGFCNIGGEKVDVARNYLIDQVLESGAKYMLWVGEDTIMPYDGFLKLHEVAEKNPDAMVVGVYYVKFSVPMIMIKQGQHIIPANVDPGQVFEAWQTGLDAALIPVSILKALKDEDPELPFCCIATENEKTGLPFIGEDNFFVYRLRKNGFRTLVNTDVQCLHCDLMLHKYTAHPDIDEKNYVTNFPLKGRLTIEDREIVDKRYIERMPKGSGHKNAD